LSDSPFDTFSIDGLQFLPGVAVDLYRKLGITRPFLSAVELRDELFRRELPPYRAALEIASIASVMRWPFHDILHVVHDFPLPDFAPLVDSIADTLQPISYRDQLSVLTKSLSLCIHAATAAGTAPPQTRQAVIDLIGSLSASLGATRGTAAPLAGHPPAHTPPPGDPVTSASWFEEDPPPDPTSAEAADPPADPDAAPAAPPPSGGAARATAADGTPRAQRPKKRKGKAAAPPSTATAAPIPTTLPPKATPPHLPRPNSYAAATASQPKPKPNTRPSLVVSLGHSTLATNLKAQAQTQAPSLVAACNEALQSDAC